MPWHLFLVLHIPLHPDVAFEAAADGGFAPEVVAVDADAEEEIVAEEVHDDDFLAGEFVFGGAEVLDRADDGIIV